MLKNCYKSTCMELSRSFWGRGGGGAESRMKLKNPHVGCEYFLERHFIVALPLNSALKDK